MNLDEFFQNEPLLRKIITIGIWVALLLILGYVVRRGLSRTLKTNEKVYRSRKYVNYVILFLIIILVATNFSDQVAAWGITIGIVAAAVAFALQEVILSFAGWVQIVLGRIVEVGDRVKIGEVKGDIIDIGLINTTIMEVGDWIDGDLYNGRMVSVANSFVFREAIHNYSSDYPFLWDEIQIPLRLDSNYFLAQKEFEKILLDECGEYANRSEMKWQELTTKYRIEAAQVQPLVTLRFDENWITFTLRYVVDYKGRRSTKDRIYKSILSIVDNNKEQIQIAIPSMEVYSK